ncbi:hypothetical protein [Streptomyces roseochromogenus]|uniref:Uncharacterized protein n=1 Tax=Streptomyces roseochromogenus subsp. oscitans DS 12.976 TaxID=1352936 RepID=V6KV68_STRRC|nr:hypothetical protein [Streptomyces roseochromogenus]EST36042.1 hypothetical protein M878_03500 [Streptomyces roseochromogenus subsp. oscitans DS 12.976]
MLAGVVWAGGLGLVINGVLVGVERRLFAWAREPRPETRKPERGRP